VSYRSTGGVDVVALVAAVLLPLGFLTGLLGVNAAGIPGAENRLAFALVCTILVALAVWQYAGSLAR
jgi:zinc transporter